MKAEDNKARKDKRANHKNTSHLSFLILLLSSILQLSFISAQNSTFDLLVNEINKISVFKKTKAFEILDSLYLMAYKNQDSSFLFRCIYEESILKQRQGIIDTLLANKILDKLSNKNLQIQDHLLLQSALGANLISQGKYAEAFPLLLKELEVAKQLKIDRITIRNLNYLGNICNFINLNSLANSYFSEAMEYVTPDIHEYYYTKSNAFIILARNNVTVAIDSMYSLIETAKNRNQIEILPLLYLNIGSYLLVSSADTAMKYFLEMKNLNFDNHYLETILYSNIGSYYFGKNDYPQALYNFKYAQNVMETNNDLINLSYLYNDISFTFDKLNMLDSALLYSRKNQELTYKLSANTIAIETRQKYITNLVEAQQKDLLIAKQQNELKNRHFTIVLIISIASISVISLFLLFTNQQKRRKASENRELIAKLKHKEEMEKLEYEKQKEILDAKTRELTSYSLLLLNKNNLLNNIYKLNTQILDNYGKKIEASAKIDEIIKNNLNIDEEWDNFKMHFEKVHPHFFAKLIKLCKDLSIDNLKICAYIRMGMSNKEIAQLLHVEYNSVVVGKQRIKKKLQLDDDVDFSEFLMGLQFDK